jgi:hypothetical protein
MRYVLGRIERVRLGYVSIVRRLVRVSIIGVVIVAGVAAASFFLLNRLPETFLPEEDQGAIFAAMRLPGASITRTEDIVKEVEAIVRPIPGVEGILSVVGLNFIDYIASSNQAFFVIRLKPGRRKYLISDFNAEARKFGRMAFESAWMTVAKYMAKRRRPPSHGWRTFVHKHADAIASIDMFVVPTISFGLLYGLLILRQSRRELLWLGVTAHPNAEWLARQLTEACGWDEPPRLLDPRPRRRVWHCLHPAHPGDGHSRPTSLGAVALAERICGEVDRLDPTFSAQREWITRRIKPWRRRSKHHGNAERAFHRTRHS